jgi:hypothetical protein
LLRADLFGGVTRINSSMKKIAIITAVFIFVLVLTKIADEVPADPPSGAAFALKAQRVIQCTPNEITLVSSHGQPTHLETDANWPDCSTYQKDQAMDFYLSRGEKTHFMSLEPTSWWRKSM